MASTTVERSPGAGFYTMWFGQTLSQVGSASMSFGLSVWLFQKTNSALQFSYLALLTAVITVIVPFFVSRMVDLSSRKRVMMTCDIVAGIAGALLWLAYSNGFLPFALIAVATAVSATVGSIHLLAYMSSIPQLVEKNNYSRATGLLQLGAAAAQVAAPVLGAMIVSTLGLGWIIGLNIVSYAIAVATLWLVHYPPAPAAPGPATNSGGVFGAVRDAAAAGTRFHLDNPAFLWLLILFIAVIVSTSAWNVLLTPLMVGEHGAHSLALVAGAGGVGMLAGGLTAATFKARREVELLLLGGVGMGVSLILLGAAGWDWVRAVCAFLYLFAFAIFSAFGQALWQRQIAPDQQARVLGYRRSITQTGVLVGYLALPRIAEALNHRACLSSACQGATQDGVRIVFAGTGIGVVAVAALVACRPVVWRLAAEVRART
jgi:DHA3 family macrolide efflux protein-like MFS transporter